MSLLFRVAAIYLESKTDLTSANDCRTSFTNLVQVGLLSSKKFTVFMQTSQRSGN